MNMFYRILVAVYAFISTILCGIIMLSPFSDRKIMTAVLDYIDVTFYRSNQYDAMLFVFGLVFLALNIAVLTSGIKGKRSNSYYCTNNETGIIRISANSIENIALGLSKRFNGVKDAKSKVKFTKRGVEVSVRLSVFPDVHVPNLCKSVQERIKESVESTMEIAVALVDVSVDGVYAATKTEE